MSDGRAARILGLVLLALTSGVSAAGAVELQCLPVGACPMMAGMPSDHCASPTSLSANCCGSMQRAETGDVAKPAPVQPAGLDRAPARTKATHRACSPGVVDPLQPRARAPELYTLLLSLLL